MNRSFQHALFERHPRLLRYLREQGRQGYGTFECDDGWFAFLDEALSSFEQAVVDIPTNSDDYPDVTMVKSRFGELRIVMTGRSSILNFEDIYCAFQQKGKTTCEFCGNLAGSQTIAVTSRLTAATAFRPARRWPTH